MLTHYLDFTLRADPEFPPNQLLTALYAKLHRVLVQLQTQELAVSFPGYSRKPVGLGNTLRVLGRADSLAELMRHPWLTGMADHVQVSTIGAVPNNAEYHQLLRVQAKSNPERLRRRQMKRHGVTAEEARELIPDTVAESLNLPFLTVHSSSTGQVFLLFLNLGPSLPGPSLGAFNYYGLSGTATIPWF